MMNFKNSKISPFNRSFNGWFALINHQTTTVSPQTRNPKNCFKWRCLILKKILVKPLEDSSKQKEAAAPGLPTPVHVVGRPGRFTSAVRFLLHRYPAKRLPCWLVGVVCFWQSMQFFHIRTTEKNISDFILIFAEKVSNDQFLRLGDCSHLMEKPVTAGKNARSVSLSIPKRYLRNGTPL